MDMYKPNYRYSRRYRTQTPNRKIIVLLVSLVSITLLPGCADWKKKYDALNVEHQNTLGLLAHEKAKKSRLAGQVSQGRQTIEELQRQFAENKSAAKATGFGKGYDVAFDPADGTITVTLPNAILFSPGKAVLKRTAGVELDHIKSVLQNKYPCIQIDVVGHTDSNLIKKSKWKDNWDLSAQRALSVIRYLVTHGIAEDKIRQVSCGAARPIASNATASSKARNRRVDIVVYMK